MRTKILLCVALVWVSMPFGLAEGVADKTNAPELDGRRELEKARSVFRQPGCMKTTSKKMDGKKTHTITTYYRIADDGTRVVRRESEIRYPHVTSLRVTVNNAEGMWALAPGVAIKIPLESKILEVDSLIAELEKDDGPRLHYLAEEYEEDGRSFLRISEMLDARIQKVLESKSDDIASRAARAVDPKVTASNRTKVAADLKNRFPSRKEYIIDRQSGLITAEYTYSKNGERTSTKNFDGVERMSPLPDEMFRVPVDSQLLFPKTASECFSLLRKHRDEHIKKQKKT